MPNKKKERKGKKERKQTRLARPEGSADSHPKKISQAERLYNNCHCSE
jgi:hypothetical protein